MAYDILKKKQTPGDWSCGASDLPASAHGYLPETFWKPAEMEAKLQEILGKPKSFMGPKPTREEGVVILAKFMKDRKIGPMDVLGTGIGSQVGNILFPKKLADKIDDVRYDVRRMGGLVGAGVFALAGAFAFLGFAEVYRTSKGR
jgi:hypothetical protein